MDDSLLSRAFDVEEVSDDFDPNVPPSTGHEYLQHVMYEASKCPKVVVADIDRKKIKNHINIDIELCNEVNEGNLAPSAEWEHHQIALFSELRRKVELFKKSGNFQPISLPKPHSEDQWRNICLGEEECRLEPSLSLLLSMSESLLGRVLEYQLEWLEEDGLRPNQGKWIYALLACLNLPLTPDTCSILRDMARQCAKVKRSQGCWEENMATTLNLIICLVRKYFGQLDLTD